MWQQPSGQEAPGKQEVGALCREKVKLDRGDCREQGVEGTGANEKPVEDDLEEANVQGGGGEVLPRQGGRQQPEEQTCEIGEPRLRLSGKWTLCARSARLSSSVSGEQP